MYPRYNNKYSRHFMWVELEETKKVLSIVSPIHNKDYYMGRLHPFIRVVMRNTLDWGVLE